MSPSAHNDTIASEVLSASLGGAISASILYPLEVLKTKMQAEGSATKSSARTNGANGREKEEEEGKKSQKGMVDYAMELYEKEGFQVFLNGIETSAFQSAMEKAFYFFAYTGLKDLYQTIGFLAGRQQPSIDGMTNLALGCLAEWCHLPITMPIDCLTTAIQTSSSKTTGSQQQTAFAILMGILKEGNMYKGIQAYYVLCFKPALQYTVYEQVKARVLAQRSSKTLSASESFLLGMIARTIATLAVFPFVRAKVVLQSQNKQTQQTEKGQMTSPTTSKQSTTIWSLLTETYDADGIPGLYRGIGPELTRGVFSAALMLMIKEQINGAVKNMLYGSSRSTMSHHHHHHHLRR